jgi:hypothetical protein
MTELGKLIGVLGLIAMLIIYSAFSWGFVTYKLYGWFVLSSFPTLTHFTVIQFVGFALFVNALIRHSGTQIKKEYKDENMEHFGIVMAPWLTLTFSWFIHILFF